MKRVILCFALSCVVLTAEENCYPPQYYQPECDLGVFLTVDFLYWYASESDLVWATKIKNDNGVIPTRHLHFDPDWSAGVRFGIGRNFGCDGWDLFLNWTYLHNTATDSAKDNIFNPWAYGDWFAQSVWQNGTSTWQLNFDVMDFELGRKFWLSPCFTLRPFGGLRGTWLHTRYRVRTNSSFPTSFQENASFIRNNYWGIGLLGGLQPSWAICDSVFLFSGFGGSLVWGRFWGSTSNTALFQELSLKNHEKEGFHRMQAMFDLALGVHWEEDWFCQRLTTSLDVSWEYHYWPNFGLRNQSQGSFHNQVITDLSLSGLVVRARFDF